ncbi:hypothetical protein MUK42_04429 [Musa troglodytarum]|uniref:Uncharacterized protein n=1 Tax=Musa troglodytarum TaxID=320322 RepID=A0A9E7KCU7_9LILI|nr:hypothetical protein MUK42_04429 [Musa troglodytarum]
MTRQFIFLLELEKTPVRRVSSNTMVLGHGLGLPSLPLPPALVDPLIIKNLILAAPLTLLLPARRPNRVPRPLRRVKFPSGAF